MSLVGTRPILQDELRQYELHHRARIAIKTPFIVINADDYYGSRDMDVHGEFDTIEPLQATGDPYDPFALQKACLLACGIIPREGHTLGEILERLGSGFVMHSEVRNVPKGSGLGTSSILSAACVKAVFTLWQSSMASGW